MNRDIKLTFWYGDGSPFGFAVVAGTLEASSLTNNVYTFDSNYTLDAGAASATRISLDFTYVRPTSLRMAKNPARRGQPTCTPTWFQLQAHWL